MPLTDSYTPVTKSARLPYTLSWSTRFGKDILENYDVRAVMLAALETAADANDASILSVATTSSSVRCHVLAPSSVSPSTLLTRLKNAAARSIAAAQPELIASQGGIFRRSGTIEPFLPASLRVPTNAEPDSSEPESLAVSRGGADSTASALSGSASRTHVSESSDA